MEKILLAWSGGKDSALALYEILKTNNYKVIALLTTVTEEYNRISMHGIREELLWEQSYSIDLPLEKVSLQPDCSNEIYEKQIEKVLLKYIEKGITGVAFGDIFLEEVRKYRENQLKRVNLKPIFPLWGKKSHNVSKEFINNGFKAILSCVDTEMLAPEYSGRLYDESLLNDFPDHIDCCGENGEFHSFVFDGPIFRYPVQYSIGEKVLRDNRFYYTDFIPEKEKTCLPQG
jgi:uncharacterized protein (TIGR00290 family)